MLKVSEKRYDCKFSFYFIKNQAFRQKIQIESVILVYVFEIFTNQRFMNGIYWKSVKQRIESFFEKVYDCILIFTDRLG